MRGRQRAPPHRSLVPRALTPLASQFDSAMTLIKKMKLRFQESGPAVLSSFCDILTKYQADSMSLNETRSRVKALMRGHADLLADFDQFVPSLEKDSDSKEASAKDAKEKGGAFVASALGKKKEVEIRKPPPSPAKAKAGPQEGWGVSAPKAGGGKEERSPAKPSTGGCSVGAKRKSSTIGEDARGTEAGAAAGGAGAGPSVSGGGKRLLLAQRPGGSQVS